MSCKFCGSTEQGERISSCKKRAHLQGFSTEYIMGTSQNGLTNFVKKIEYNTMFESQNTIPESYLTIGENSKSRHFFIHKVWKMPMMCNELYVPIDNVIFQFSYITKFGEIDEKKSFIRGKALHSMLVACNLKKGPFFLFDNTPYKDDVMASQNSAISYDTYENFLTQNSNGFFSQNINNYCNGGIFRNTFPQVSTLNPFMTSAINYSNNTMGTQIFSVQGNHSKHGSNNETSESFDIAEI